MIGATVGITVAVTLSVLVIVGLLILRSRRAPRGPENRARWVDRDELRPDVREAYERGRMSNEQMVELLRAGGWDVQLRDGKIVDAGRPRGQS